MRRVRHAITVAGFLAAGAFGFAWVALTVEAVLKYPGP